MYQKSLLEESYERQGIDVFVATYSVIRSDDGECSSYAVLSNGVDSLLPKTDVIMFMESEDAPPIRAKWEDVERACGDLLEPMDCHPPRYRVTGFPSAEVLSGIGEEV